MGMKKIALLVVLAFVLACIPVVAGAVPILQPTYNQVIAGDTKVTGTSVSALSLTATFPNGNTASTTTPGGGASWSIPVSGTLKEDDSIRIDYTGNGQSGYLYINVAPAGKNLDGTPADGGGGTNNGGVVNGSDEDTNTASGGTVSPGSGASNTGAGMPKTGNAAPMFGFAGGLFVIGLALMFLTRGFWMGREE